MKTGTHVRLIQPVIEGVVKERRITADDQLELLVVWQEDGETVERWFDPGQLQAQEDAQ